MAYSIGNDILDDEYNVFATGSATGTPNHLQANVNSVFGSGQNNIGWGQVDPVSAVAAEQDVSAAEWATMLNAINTAAVHQGTTLGAVINPSPTDNIEILTSLSQNITDIYANRLNCAATGTPITADGTIDRVADWKVSVLATLTCTFDSANELRYFFNAGGRLTLAASRSGGSGHSKNSGWTDLLAAMGTIHLTAASGVANIEIVGTTYTGTTKTGGSGTPTTLDTATGIYDLTGSNTEIFKQYALTANYTANYVIINAKISGTVVTFEVQYIDAAADEPVNPGLDIVDGTLSTVLTAIPPGTGSILTSWGTPVLSSSQSGS